MKNLLLALIAALLPALGVSQKLTISDEMTMHSDLVYDIIGEIRASPVEASPSGQGRRAPRPISASSVQFIRVEHVWSVPLSGKVLREVRRVGATDHQADQEPGLVSHGSTGRHDPVPCQEPNRPPKPRK